MPKAIFSFALAIVYLPVIAATIGGKPGGAIWKFLSFILCTIALGTFVLFVLSLAILGFPALVLAIIAWLFA